MREATKGRVKIGIRDIGKTKAPARVSSGRNSSMIEEQVKRGRLIDGNIYVESMGFKERA